MWSKSIIFQTRHLNISMVKILNMRIILLFLFTIFAFDISSKSCDVDVSLGHCSVEQVDCHDQNEPISDTDHGDDCGCGCHVHSSIPVIELKSSTDALDMITFKKKGILFHYLLQLSDFKYEIHRPPIFLS